MRLFRIAVFLALLANSEGLHAADWKVLAPGLDLCYLHAKNPNPVGDSNIIIVRANPTIWQLAIVGRSTAGNPANLTAREWARSQELVVAINAGMYATDHLTHVGYMQQKEHQKSGDINDYRSVAAFDPRNPGGQAPFRIFDLDEPGVTIQAIRRDYTSLVQNLRLIKRPGRNQWGKKDKMWSEAALGEDKEGRILFIFSRSPFSMHEFNQELLSAEIGLVAAQHLEGGPEAQLYIKIGSIEIESFGSYETAFKQDDENPVPWPIPNVLGIRKK